MFLTSMVWLNTEDNRQSLLLFCVAPILFFAEISLRRICSAQAFLSQNVRFRTVLLERQL